MAQLQIGIVGLPNVGKSTLFNALLKKQVAYAANYPFATIEPNVGVVEVPDERLPALAKIVNTQKIVPAVVEFYDIAGLVAGASQGEGLGNKFLSHIREVAAIAHVTRLFEDGDVIHVANSVDAARDIGIIDTELILADLSTIEKQREPKGKASKEDILRWEAVQKLKTHLDAGKPARTCELTDEEAAEARGLQMLTMKPMIFVFNVSEKQLEDKSGTEQRIKEVLKKSGYGNVFAEKQFIFLNAKLENDVLAFSEEEQKEYLNQFNLTDTGLNRLIKKAYEVLGLISYLTGGELEARAWTIARGTLAPDAAGAIHTDFTKKFIKADIVQYEKFIEAPGWVKSREKGYVQTVGRDHVMHDGDVVDFKIGA
ncbi:redox-regulated ATPase YchF [soil metagenome]